MQKTKASEIMILKENFESIKKTQLILNTKIDIMTFINKVQNFKNKENIYYNDIKIFCLQGQNSLKEVDVCSLKSLTLDLYSFKIMCIYRKISHLLLQETIYEKKNFFIYEHSLFKSINHDQDLENIIAFFFWVKDSINKLIHFSRNENKFFNSLINQKKEENLDLKEIENIKSINDFFKELGKCTNKKLIEYLNIDNPLLLFNQNVFKKDAIEYNINNLLSKLKKMKQ